MTFANAGSLFAQAGGGGGASSGGEEFVVVFVILFYVILFAGAISIQVMYLLTLSRALRACHPKLRLMEPGQVWLNLIPCFGIVWIFITVSHLSESLRREFRDRGMRGDGDFGKGIGTAYCVLVVCCCIPYLGALASIPALICWIMYWVKIAGYNRQLADGESYRDREDDEYRQRYEDEDDDRPSRRRDDDRDDEDDRPSRRRRYDD